MLLATNHKSQKLPQGVLLKDKLRKLKSQLPYLPKTTKLIWQALRWWSVAWAALLVLGGILPVDVYLVQPIIDGNSHASGKNIKAVDIFMAPVITCVIILLYASSWEKQTKEFDI